MNDIATIERALKDADRIIEKTGDIYYKDAEQVRAQITQALMLLRQIPGQHSPTTATRQAVVALENALRHYAELGPAKMERKDLDLIRDAALTQAEAERDEAREFHGDETDRANGLEALLAQAERERDYYRNLWEEGNKDE